MHFIVQGRTYDSLVEACRQSGGDVVVETKTADTKYWEWLNNGRFWHEDGWRLTLFNKWGTRND